jgi:hypothetical protein
MARYCPRCGVRLSDPPDPSRVRGPFSNVVLRGYASAMYRLGTRYEARHNDDEAVRCYVKSSRLGNEQAKSRLGDIPLAALFKPSG